MRGSISHYLKFCLWDFARLNPTLGRPIQYAGSLVMRGADQALRNQLKILMPSVLPKDAYTRSEKIPTQTWILTDGADEHSIRAMVLLLNHIRVPFRMGPLSAYRGIKPGQLSLVLAPGTSLTQAKEITGPLVVVFNSKAKSEIANVVVITGSPTKLLPHLDGLRSHYCASLLTEIRENLPCPLVTGMFPAEVALRLDDVKGKAIDDYLPAMLSHGWKPNLGLFMDSFEAIENPSSSRISKLAEEGNVTISPHAFSENNLIYFDLAWCRPYDEKEFIERWNIVKRRMKENKFTLSKTINAHFHVLSRSAARILAEQGAQYFFSEYEPDTQQTIPDPEYWPSGDPLHCTGRLDQSGIVQISAGNSMSTLQDPRSHYDFLMHIKDGDTDEACNRLKRRIRLNLACGFPAYCTTHEQYLWGCFNAAHHEELWDKVDLALNDANPVKVSMDTIGMRCHDHRSVIIESIRELEARRYEITLSGHCSGEDRLRIIGNGMDTTISVPPFDGQKIMEIGPFKS